MRDALANVGSESPVLTGKEHGVALRVSDTSRPRHSILLRVDSHPRPLSSVDGNISLLLRVAQLPASDDPQLERLPARQQPCFGVSRSGARFERTDGGTSTVTGLQSGAIGRSANPPERSRPVGKGYRPYLLAFFFLLTYPYYHKFIILKQASLRSIINL